MRTVHAVRFGRRGSRLGAVLLAIGCLAVGPSVGPVLAAGDANVSACSNEGSPGFRNYLPDCRAYEMVSPAFKAGWPISAEGQLAREGVSITGSSLGVFAGANADNGSFNLYNLTRTDSGWSTNPIDVPLTQFGFNNSANGLVPVNSSGNAVIMAHPASGSIYDARLYLRRPDRSLTEIGPTLPPSAIPPSPTGIGDGRENQNIVAATPDLSHVLFTLDALPPNRPDALPPGIASNLWEGDESIVGSEAPSLYEYVGTGNSRPTLVGVDNAGHVIGQCGTYFGGDSGRSLQGNGNTHNALSEDGRTIYFMAKGDDDNISRVLGCKTAGR